MFRSLGAVAFPSQSSSLPKIGRQKRSRPTGRLVEPLEVRQLLSASLNVTGDGVAIISGSTTTSASNATDFGFDAAGAGVVQLTRTYSITNTTGSAVTLSGPVTVTGGSARDFTITSQPASLTLGAGDSTTVTVGFSPKGSGVRKTTLSIGITGESAYTFAIQGTGETVKTLAGGTEEGTITPGTGGGAINGDALTVEYTGTLADGTTFVSPFNAVDAQPFDLILGNNNTLPALESALVSIKKGETRLVVIPDAYPAGAPGIPAGATVIYTVKADLVLAPTLVIKGTDGSTIAFNSNKTSTTNGTDLGTVAFPATTASSTFHLSDNSIAPVVLGMPDITVTGASASMFTVSHDSNSPDFTVTFTPTGNFGTKTATINVHSNDPAHPDFTFTVQGEYSPFVDLTVAIGTTHFPTTTTSGNGTNINVPVVISNAGNGKILGGQKTDIQIFAHNTDSSTDTLVGTFNHQDVSGIGEGTTRTVMESVNLPIGFASGNYTFFATINQSASITETDTSNDTSAPSTQSIAVTEGHVDITSNLVSTTLPTAVVSGNKVNGNVVIVVHNTGNVPLPKGQQVMLVARAHNTGDSTDTTLATITKQAVSQLKAGGNMTFTIPVNLTGGLTTGTYQIEVDVTPVQALPEDDPNNNTATQTGNGGTFTITSAAPFTDISATLGNSNLPAAGGANAALNGSVTIKISNAGNEAILPGGHVVITIIAHNTDDSTDTTLATSASLPLGAVPLNGSKTFSVPVSFTAGLPAGNYTLEAQVTPDFSDAVAGNNLATLNGKGNPIDLTIT